MEYFKSCLQQILEDRPHLRNDSNFLVRLGQQLHGIPVVGLHRLSEDDENIPLNYLAKLCKTSSESTVKTANIQCSVHPPSKATVLQFHIKIPGAPQQCLGQSSVIFNFELGAYPILEPQVTQEVFKVPIPTRRQTRPQKTLKRPRGRCRVVPSKRKKQSAPNAAECCVDPPSDDTLTKLFEQIVEEQTPIEKGELARYLENFSYDLAKTPSRSSTPKLTPDNSVCVRADDANNYTWINHTTDEYCMDSLEFQPPIVINVAPSDSDVLMANNNGVLVSDSTDNNNLVDTVCTESESFGIALNMPLLDNDELLVSSNDKCSVDIKEMSEVVCGDVTREPGELHKTTLNDYDDTCTSTNELAQLLKDVAAVEYSIGNSVSPEAVCDGTCTSTNEFAQLLEDVAVEYSIDNSVGAEAVCDVKCTSTEFAQLLEDDAVEYSIDNSVGAEAVCDVKCTSTNEFAQLLKDVAVEYSIDNSVGAEAVCDVKCTSTNEFAQLLEDVAVEYSIGNSVGAEAVCDVKCTSTNEFAQLLEDVAVEYSIGNSVGAEAVCDVKCTSTNDVTETLKDVPVKQSIENSEMPETVSDDHKVKSERVALHTPTFNDLDEWPVIDLCEKEEVDRSQLEVPAFLKVENWFNFDDSYDNYGKDDNGDFQPSRGITEKVNDINSNTKNKISKSAESTRCLSVLDTESSWHNTLDYEVDDLFSTTENEKTEDNFCVGTFFEISTDIAAALRRLGTSDLLLAYNTARNNSQLFNRHFLIFAEIFGQRKNIEELFEMIVDWDRYGDDAQHLDSVFHNLVQLCGLSRVYVCQQILKRVKDRARATKDVLVNIIIAANWTLFVPVLETLAGENWHFSCLVLERMVPEMRRYRSKSSYKFFFQCVYNLPVLESYDMSSALIKDIQEISQWW